MQVSEYFFEETKAKPKNLFESLRGKIPERLLPYLPHSFDIIGEIAVVELPHELAEFSSAIGEGVLEINPHLRLVLRKSSEVSGKFRTRKFEAVAGVGSTETVHKEFSCLLQLDVAKVYFNPRLSHERMRVARQVKEDERILDMFAGVGPYSILIAKIQQDSKIYSVDINPEAFRYLERNILLNRVADRVVPILGDAGKLAARELSRTADRVIMNLPSESSRFLQAAVKALKEDGGVIHYYTFASRTESIDEIKKTVGSAIGSQGRIVDSFTFSDVIKEVASSRVQVALDIVVK
jgi:tRNA (guanine37-N1)-methyltransferase